MPEQKAIHTVRLMHRNWMRWSVLTLFVKALSGTIVLIAIIHFFAGIDWIWGLVVLIILTGIVFLTARSWKSDVQDMVRYLDKTYPELEESTALLFAQHDLNMLETLQAEKTAIALEQLPVAVPYKRKLFSSVYLLLVAVLLSWLISLIPYKRVSSSVSDQITPGKKREVLPGGITAIDLLITPPPYTHKPSRRQKQFGLRAEAGAELLWEIHTTGKPVAAISFVFNDSLKMPLAPVNNDSTVWRLKQKIEHSGFYQVKNGNLVSELYRMEVIPDQSPAIALHAPKANTVIDFGEPKHILVDVSVTDDYGISDVHINATVATGSGEGVRFKEQKIGFKRPFAGTGYDLKKAIDLAAMGLSSGDELYLYVSATDNHGQEKKSDVYVVTIADTAELMSMNGLISSVSVKPEFFRSQRQIIIESEQLLRDKPTLTTEQFNKKSNDLGIDQKLLRLRYGKFLGEENEFEGGHEDDGHEGSDEGEKNRKAIENFGNVESIMDEFSHKHDIAEDASFFAPETKEQLKATLAEMWKAELQLRTYKPMEALPFEYKALRLLKDLQQKSRSYVAKTSYKTTPLSLQKRLTGNLEKINGPIKQSNIKPAAGRPVLLARALSDLHRLSYNETNIALAPLQEAYRELSSYAASQPGTYLAGFEAMKQILDAIQNHKPVLMKNILLAETVLQKIMQLPEQLPGNHGQYPGNDLWGTYFKNLQNSAQP